MSDHSGVRNQFRILRDNPRVAYLDSAATTQKPDVVVTAVLDQLTSQHANTGRGIYPWANATTIGVENAKVTIKRFLGDRSNDSNVVLTSGTTEALELIASQYLSDQLVDGDQIMYPAMDHRANEIPWSNLVKRLGAAGTDVIATPLPYTPGGDYDYDAIAELATPRLRFVAMTHVHHVYGTDMDVAAMRRAVGPNVLLSLDCAQSLGHMPVEVDELDVDFIAFSGHKVFGPTGTGALWSRNSRSAPFDDARWSGTPNITGIAGLVAALDWVDALGVESIEAHIDSLTARAARGLGALPGVSLVGCAQDGCTDASWRHGIVAFRHESLAAGDIGFILAADDIYVRSDSHCQSGVANESSVRASFHIYSSADEIDRLVDLVASI